MNGKAVEYAVKIGHALNCSIADYSKMDRKNYYYPDLPKAYQVSQYDKPLNYGGHLDIVTKEGTKRIGVTRAHLEKTRGKLVHAGGKSGRLDSSDYSLADYNRGVIPLVEIVSEPDIRSSEEAHAYLTALKSILLYMMFPTAIWKKVPCAATPTFPSAKRGRRSSAPVPRSRT